MRPRTILGAIWRWLGHVGTVAFLWSIGGSAIFGVVLRSVTSLSWPWIFLLAVGVGCFILAGILTFRATLGSATEASSERSVPQTPQEWIDPNALADSIVRLLVERGFGRSRSPSPERSAKGEAPSDRIIVDVQPEDLNAFYRDYMDIQADGLVKPYIGKWMKVSGPMYNVTAWDGQSFQVRLDPNTHTYAYLVFTDRSALERVLAIPRGTIIEVLGRIHRIGVVDLVLMDCELISAGTAVETREPQRIPRIGRDEFEAKIRGAFPNLVNEMMARQGRKGAVLTPEEILRYSAEAKEKAEAIAAGLKDLQERGVDADRLAEIASLGPDGVLDGIRAAVDEFKGSP